VIVAFAARLALAAVLGTSGTFVFFVLAVVFIAARVGLGPAIFASLVSGLAATYAFIPPPLSLVGETKLTNLLAFLAICTAVILFAWRVSRQREQLQKREEKLATEAREYRLIDAAQDYAIYELDPEGRILTWNKGAERLKGWKAEEIIGKPYNVLHTPESRANNAPGRELKIAAETGRFEEEAPRMRKDGSIFAAHVALFPMRDENGEVTGYVKVTRDISDRSKAGKAILETRRRMEGIVQSAMDAIITIDEKQRIVLFNPAAEKIFGYTADQVLGEQVTKLIPERYRANHADHVQQFFASGVLNRPLTGASGVSALRSSQEEFPVEASISQVTIAGERVGTIILRDITERNANEEARALLAREVDHRAKNALAVAQALVALTKGDTVEDFAEAVRGRIAALARAHTLLSKSQWRGAPLGQLIRDELLPYARDSQLTIVGPPITCSAAAVQSLSLLFHELATNAIKYGSLGSEKGHVSVDWTLDQDAMTVCWEERGGPKVSPPKREGFGTKLLKQVTGRQLDADLDFHWEPEGLKVEIRLPRDLFMAGVPGERNGIDEPDSVDMAGLGRKRRVLLVEDEELVALELSIELSRLGWAVVGPAATLAEAQALISTQVDAAVLDVNLRGKPVYPVAEALAKQDVPFLFCTGYEVVDPEGRFADVPVIRKPIEPSAVSAALSDLLSRR
jgi:PAS domain S-box-containing protein